MLKHLLGLLLLLTTLQIAEAQQDSTAPKRKHAHPGLVLIDVQMGWQKSFKDMQKYFIANGSLTGKVSYYTPRNWIVGVGADYQFGDNVNMDVVANLREPSTGSIIDKQGALGNVQLQQRGFQFYASVGKLIAFAPEKHHRFGLELQLTGGYFEHWFRIRTFGKDMVQLTKEYKRGYDRKSSGFATEQLIGLRFLSKNRLVNLYVGFTVLEGFTYNRRAWNFDEMRADNDLHFDVLMGFKAGVSIPFYIFTENTVEERIRFY